MNYVSDYGENYSQTTSLDLNGNKYLVGYYSATLTAGDHTFSNTSTMGIYDSYLAKNAFGFYLPEEENTNVIFYGGDNGEMTLTIHFGIFSCTYSLDQGPGTNSSTLINLSKDATSDFKSHPGR